MKESMIVPGVFPFLVNAAAFIDKVVIGIRGKRRQRSSLQIRGNVNLAIGGPGRVYARCLPRRHLVSGNGLQLKYGHLKHYKNIPPFVMVLRSVGSPVTCADALLCLDGLMRLGYRAVVSSVEVTFDTTGVPLWQVERQLCARAGFKKIVGGDRRCTNYVGSPTSAWQMRIYEKTPSILRVEFVLRNEFLRAHGIRKLQDLLLVKKIDFSKCVDFRVVDHSGGHELPRRIQDAWTRRGFDLPPAMPAAVVAHALRQDRIDPARWVVRSDFGTLLSRMQRNLIW